MIDDLDLAPCPLCGGRARHEVRYRGEEQRGVITCNSCSIRLEGDYGRTSAEIVTRWNNRGRRDAP